MCGIACILESNHNTGILRERALNMARLLRHRGPDWSGIYADERAILTHERLSIVDPEHGGQPMTSPSGDVVLSVNGEIYNHTALRTVLSEYQFKSNSDCEVIIPLYERDGAGFLNHLLGIFSFVLYDKRRNDYLIARDPIGVVPLYYGRDEMGRLCVASEMKALLRYCHQFQDFPPGHLLTKGMEKPQKYHAPQWRSYEAVKDNPLDLTRVRTALESAVQRQIMCDVPYGVLISGGLDSSVVSACTRQCSLALDLHSFSVGLEGSPDLTMARKVARTLDTIHHEFVFTVQEGLDSLNDVIYHVESYDVTTVRASTPMFLMARRIKALGIKMVLSGEGADEAFAGYLYFHKAPNPRELHEETVRKLDLLYKYDCLRANKSMAAWGVEVRVPFLDREFLDVAMAFDPAEKMVGRGKIEKYPLRKAFEGYLPAEVLWRQKEQFSDGVGYQWIDSLRAMAEQRVSDAEFEGAAGRFPFNTPLTKEAYLYRDIFDRQFPGESAARTVPGGPSIACSTPTAIAWDQAFARNADPSGRSVVGVHKSDGT